MRKTYKSLIKRGKGHDFDPKAQQLFHFKVVGLPPPAQKKGGPQAP